jgi:hypothetical protein
MTFAGAALAQDQPDASQPPPLLLEWHSSPGCSSREEVLDRVGRILRGSPSPQRRVDARASIQRHDDGTWQVDLATTTDDTSHERSFEAESCAAVQNAVALILALAVNPPASPASPSTGSPPEPSAPSSAPATPSPPETFSGAPRSRGRELALLASIVTDVGSLPRPAVGGGLALGWSPNRWRSEIAAVYWEGQTATAPSTTAGAHFEFLSLEARAGYAWPLGPFGWGPLASLGVGLLQASGFGGTVRSFNQSSLLPTVGGGTLVEWRPGRLFVVNIEAECLASPSPPSFVVLQPAPAASVPVHTPSAVLGRAFLSAGISFL